MARMAIGADEKKKLMVLGGLLGALAIVGVVVFSSGGGSTEEPPITTPPVGAPGELPPGGVAGEVPLDSPVAQAPASAPGGITAASLISAESYRSDPFMRFAAPSPPPPPPPPPPPVMIPPPVEIVSPDQFAGGGLNLPPAGINRGSESRVLTNLPPIVPRRVVSAPTAPRIFTAPGAQTSTAGILQSGNKRLSGVIIGDSVRALLEVTSGGTTTTRVVQPGDEVDGIRILRLERFTEAGRTITRLVVRENNQEQYVELRPAPQGAGAGEGGMGPDGMMPGGAPF